MEAVARHNTHCLIEKKLHGQAVARAKKLKIDFTRFLELALQNELAKKAERKKAR